MTDRIKVVFTVPANGIRESRNLDIIMTRVRVLLLKGYDVNVQHREAQHVESRE